MSPVTLRSSSALLVAALLSQPLLGSRALADTPKAPVRAERESAELDYPELMVTPRASERLATEAKEESGRRWTAHLPLQFSALATATAGVIGLTNSYAPGKEPLFNPGVAGLIVGGGWLVTSVALSAWYHPYESAQSKVSAMPYKSQRERIAAERAAEESIESAAKLGRRLTWLSFLSNAGTSAYMLAGAPSKSGGQISAAIAMGISLAPFIFKYHWQNVANEQRDYKKRIYGPVANASVLFEPGSQKAVPGMVLSYRF